jgi:hypothetical protein
VIICFLLGNWRSNVALTRLNANSSRRFHGRPIVAASACEGPAGRIAEHWWAVGFKERALRAEKALQLKMLKQKVEITIACARVGDK